MSDKRDELLETVKALPTLRKDARAGAADCFQEKLKMFADSMSKDVSNRFSAWKAAPAGSGVDSMASYTDLSAHKVFLKALKRSGVKVN